MIRALLSVMFPLILVAFSLLSGCGNVPEAQQADVRAETPPPVVVQTPPKIEFETKTDTVAMEKALLDSVAAHETRNIQIKYMVQIGAFKDPQLATSVQAAARDRYHLPVLNDFNTSHTMYQIRIGFFETREDAYDFRQKMRMDFPDDYKDAWVVQLKR